MRQGVPVMFSLVMPMMVWLSLIVELAEVCGGAPLLMVAPSVEGIVE